MENNVTLLEAEGVSKQYILGMIGRRTLHADLSSWYAKKRGKEDPNRKIGTEHIQFGEKFWALKDVSRQKDASGSVARSRASLKSVPVSIRN